MSNEKKTPVEPKPQKPILPNKKEPKPGQQILVD